MKSIHLTREGKRFLIAVVLIGFASVNTGNNLIYLIFSMMLSISLLSFVIAVINLRRLTGIAAFKEPIYAGTPLNIDIAINNKGKLSSYSVSVVLPMGISERLYFPVVRRGVNKKIFNNIVIKKRGRYFLKDIRLRTGFPFIFMHVQRSIDYGKELIVYPQIIDILPFLKNMQQYISVRETTKRGQGEDFLFAREYVYGEESRNIDWKATARMQKTMVKEFSRKDERLATVILDNSSRADDGIFEKAVSATASLCSEFIRRDYYVRLITCGKVVPFGRGRAHLFKMLDILAGVQVLDVAKCPIDELMEGLNILVKYSDTSGFSQIISQCAEVIDARDL